MTSYHAVTCLLGCKALTHNYCYSIIKTGPIHFVFQPCHLAYRRSATKYLGAPNHTCLRHHQIVSWEPIMDNARQCCWNQYEQLVRLTAQQPISYVLAASSAYQRYNKGHSMTFRCQKTFLLMPVGGKGGQKQRAFQGQIKQSAGHLWYCTMVWYDHEQVCWIKLYCLKGINPPR